MVRVVELLMNIKITSSNDPSRSYCHTRVMLLPSRTWKGSGGIVVNVGTNSMKENMWSGSHMCLEISRKVPFFACSKESALTSFNYNHSS